MICPREPPIARRMPISFERWTTDTTSTLAMPAATERPTKRRIIWLENFCAFRPRKNWLFDLIQLSASSPVCAAIDCAISSAANGSTTVRSMLDTPPIRLSRFCAVDIRV